MKPLELTISAIGPFAEQTEKLIRGGDETYCVCRYGGGRENNAL